MKVVEQQKLIEQSDDELAQDPTNDEEDGEEDEEESKIRVKQGEFVRVKFCTKKREKFHIGQVVSVSTDGDAVELSFLRKQDHTGLVFHFPEKEDKSWVDLSQLVENLATPVIDSRNRVCLMSPVVVE
jgi:hypothetical protein